MMRKTALGAKYLDSRLRGNDNGSEFGALRMTKLNKACQGG